MAALAVALACCIATTQPVAAAQSSLPADALADLAFAQHPGAALPRDVLLRDEQDRPVRVGDLFRGAKRRPIVLVFDYFRCTTLCGLVLGDLAAALQKVPLTPGRDYEVVAVSIDPRETPQDAAALKARHFERTPALAGAAQFLVGDEGEVRRLADAVGFHYRFDEALGQYAHPAGVVLVSPDGTVSRYILGIQYEPMDLRLGIVDAAQGTVASPSTQLLLLCYGYDPAQGKYNLVVGNLLRITGVASIAAVGLVILLAGRRGRRRGSGRALPTRPPVRQS
ncbi:MAG TPA: SCO family protein [Stellaceae bacterium]